MNDNVKRVMKSSSASLKGKCIVPEIEKKILRIDQYIKKPFIGCLFNSTIFRSSTCKYLTAENINWMF